MKILHVIASVWRGGGGTSEVVPRICRAQVMAGHEVSLAVSSSDAYSDSCADAISAGVGYKNYPRMGFLKRLAFSPRLKAAMPQLVANADVVHLHGLWQAPCWYAAAECRHQHKPYVMMPHGFLEPERLKISRFKKWLFGVLFERRNLANASAIIATSGQEVKGIREYGLKNPIHIMPIGVDLDAFRMHDAAISSSSAKRTLLYFSRITPIKGLDMLAEAWLRLKDFHDTWQLKIVGPSDRGYADVIRPAFKGTAEFCGPVFGDEKYALLASADAFVLPTRSENWSIAVAEAMASELPVVCTKGAPWSCLNECNAGRWVDISVDGIEEGLRTVLSCSDSERQAMGVRARQWVRDNLSWDKIARDLDGAYERILRREELS